MRASNIPGEISTSCHSAEQQRPERAMNCVLPHETPECHCLPLPEYSPKGLEMAPLPCAKPAPSSAFLKRSREIKQMEELMSKGKLKTNKEYLKGMGQVGVFSQPLCIQRRWKDWKDFVCFDF